MSIAQQTLTNLVHYNLWTDVTVHDVQESAESTPYRFALLSGLPPSKLDQSDKEGLREWVIARLLEDRHSSMSEIEQFFRAIESLAPRPKRVTLALVNDDATVTYYFVHDGAIKPRQN
ncbi:hypothetical protein PUMCH_003356 [Australozyma saopauloensis]|uniref:tRNA-splicing endonuclease subunit Sen15 domain-containing protein n=1 Tax=Australozyma saopauloensis TaxID=291208 RepID=A0AAX4HBT2_9ASCO|nr:hypothetical protein PUMCH_003356 [[Candida] saopauloensis]